ncbi:MAG: hypothetical protein NVS4B7_10160 [Ktedonobacteraceae bacterium]
MFWNRTQSTHRNSADQNRIAELERLVSQLALQVAAYNAVPITPSVPATTLSSEAFKAYIVEYEQCMDSYRHTYATIWQAGAIFSAISAAIVAFTSSVGGGVGSSGIPPFIQVLAPIPVLFWYHGIFRPMNRYGELRSDRLVELENILNSNVPDLQMNHYRQFSFARKGEGEIKRLLKFKWFWRPRVQEIINIFGLSITALELYLLWIYYVSPWVASLPHFFHLS